MIYPVAAFNDNYIWAIVRNQQALIVDPGDAEPVEAFLQENGFDLAGILITHWHPDHIGGLPRLAEKYRPRIAGPKHEAIKPLTETVADGDSVSMLGLTFSVIAIPGHTLEHIAFYCPQDGLLFCGDTLFAGGCGRIFEGNAPMMFKSLNTLAVLPGDTRVYCAHEYTLANLRFALEVEPGNLQLQQRLIDCEKLRRENACTLPSTIAIELATNPFLRATEPEVVTSALNQGACSSAAVDIFACLREWKDQF